MSRALRLVVAILALACAIGLARAVALVCLHIPLDPNEGWNAYHTMTAMAGGPLYPQPPSLLVNNYPPLSFYVVGSVGWLTGDAIVAGRIVSLLSLLAVASAIVAAARRMGASREASLFGALWFVLGLLVVTDYVGMDDPQLLGHVVAMAGLLLLLRGNTIAAAFAMALALFVKHNLVAMPIAVLIWLSLCDRRGAIRFAVSGSGFAILGLVLFRLVTGTNLIDQLGSPRLYSMATLGENVSTWTIWGGPAMAVTAALLIARRGDKYVAFCAIYALISVLSGIYFSGGAGVDLNVWFDAALALAIGSALAIDGFQRDLHKALAVLAYVLPLASAGALSSADDSAWRTADHWLHPGRDEASVAETDIAFLKRHPGPALCEMLSLCYWAGKRAEVDVFNLGQSYATRARDEAPLIRRLDARIYRAIEFDSLDDFALGPRVKLAVLRNYRVDHRSDDGVFLVPR